MRFFELLDVRAVLYVGSLLAALLASVVVPLLAWRGPHARQEGAGLVTVAALVHATTMILATVAHVVSVEAGARTFGVEGMAWPVLLNVGGVGMTLVHLGGAAVLTLFSTATARAFRAGRSSSSVSAAVPS